MVRPYAHAVILLLCAAVLVYSIIGCGSSHGSSELFANAPVGGQDASPLHMPGEVPPADAVRTGGAVQGVIQGAAQPYELPAGWSMGDLPGTMPSAPLADKPHSGGSHSASNKQTSSIDTGFATPGPHTLTASGQYPDATFYDYLASDMIDLTNMDASTNELHITGTVLQSNIKENIYAQIGLVTESVYDLALGAGQPNYMFNQSVMMLNALDSGTPFCAPLDFNGSGGLGQAQTYPGNSFTFDLKLVVDPVNDYRGLAFLSLNGGGYLPAGGFSFGVDNWGFRPAESFTQCRLVAQLYSFNLNPAVIGSITFQDVRLTDGTPGGPSPHPWPNKGRDRQRTSISPFAGPTTSNQKWPAFITGSPIVSSPALADDGTLYFCTSGLPARLFAVDSTTGAAKWAAPLTLPAGSVSIGSPALSNGTGDGPGGSKRIYIGTSAGQFYTIRDDGGNGTVINTVAGLGDMSQASAVVAGSGTVYSCAWDGFVYAFDAAGNLLWTSPGPLGFLADSPSLSVNESTVYVCTVQGNFLGLSAASGAVLHDSGALGGAFYTTPAIDAADLVYAADYLNSGTASLYSRNSNLSANWTTLLPANQVSLYSKATMGPLGIYVGCGELAAFNTATHAVKWTFTTAGAVFTYPTVDANNHVYAASGTGIIYGLQDNGATVTQLWFLTSMNSILSSPALGPDGTLYIGTQTGRLYAINDSGTPALQIDCTALANASFFVRRTPGVQNPATDPYLTPALSTNTVYDASGLGFVPGNTFYVSFAADNAAQPSDKAVYPSIPVAGLVTVTAAGMTLPAPVAGPDNDLGDYFQVVNGGWTLQLRAGAYNRVTNDLDSLDWAQYTLLDQTSGGTITGPWATNTSAADSVVFASGVRYRPLYSNYTYPTAGSTAPGRTELIYPTTWATGYIQVNGFPPSLSEGGTVLGNFYNQAGMTNSLQADAYCRFEADIYNMVDDMRVRDRTVNAWIINNPALAHLARPADTLVFARGTVFRLEAFGAPFNGNDVTVTANKTLNNVKTYTQTDPFAGTYNLNVLPVRIWDDPAASDPHQNVSGNNPWTVTLNFLLQYGATNAAGTPSQTVQLDADYGAAWNDGTAGRIYNVPGSPFTVNGLKSVAVNINNQPAGTYKFAIRVTDSLGVQYTYVWPTSVVLSAWTIVTVDSAGVAGEYTSLRVVNGMPAISYYDRTNGNLKYVRATNANGTAWGAPVTVDSVGDVGQYTSLLVVNGNPAIAYFSPDAGGGLKYVRASNNNGTAWGAPVVVDPPPAGYATSMALVNGRPAISYTDGAAQRQYYIRANDVNGAAWGARVSVDPPTLVINFSSLAVVNGRPAICYEAAITTNLQYVRAVDVNGNNWSAPVVLDNMGGGWSSMPSMAVVNGNPAVSYAYSVTNDLRFIRAVDVNGAAWGVPLTIDAAGTTGQESSLDVINGIPAISFPEAVVKPNLMYARASDANGAAWGIPELVDQSGFNWVGRWTSLEQVNAHPGISYWDQTAGDLKYATYF